MIRTGAQLLEGLRDAREVWLGGQRVEDVTTHPGLRGGARSIAALYDMQHDPACREVLTFPSPTSGDPVGMSFLEPRSVDDLPRKRQAYKAWADFSGGFIGRSPDYLSAILMGCAHRRDYFGRSRPEFADNIQRYFELCRERDLCLTHTLIMPQTNRAKGVQEQVDPYIALGVVRETSDGVVVRGCRMLATLAPFSDEIMVFPSTFLQAAPGAERYAMAFALPMATPGLKCICRDSFDPQRSTFDYPLSARFEEMDCVVVFDEVLVPWDRVFLLGDVALCNGLFRNTGAYLYAIHQFMVKNVAKAEFLVGVLYLIAETIGIGGFINVQEKIGEVVDDLETMRALVRAAEADAQPDAEGVYYPAAEPLHTARDYFPRAYPRIVEILQLLGASGLMATPSEADVRGPLAEEIEKYYQGATGGGAARVQLFRLAWDICGSAFGSRQVLYERFFSGDPTRLRANRYLLYDASPYMERVRKFMRRTPSPSGRGQG